MKSVIQLILQKILGYDRYLWYFTLFKLKTLRSDQNENDFFYFLSMIKPGSVAMDIGANLGLMSYFLAISPRINEVHSFEPMPNNLKVLKKVKKRYSLDKLIIHELALGNQNGSIELVLPVVDGVRKQGLSHVKANKMESFNEGLSVSAKIMKLDEFLRPNFKKLDAIKIDVENYEYEVFLGAKETLLKHKPLIYCELWDNQNRQDCFEFLSNLGYTVQYLDDTQLKIFDPQKSKTQNFFFIHSDH